MFKVFIQRCSAMRKTGVLLLAAFVLAAFNTGPEGNEYHIKAMFVFNFTKYVEWPETRNTEEVFTIGVFGESGITEPLEKIAAQKKVADKKIVIRKVTMEDDEFYKIIIVTQSKLSKLDFIEKKYSNKGVLVISDESPRPAAINLVTRDNKIRFEINQTLAKSGGIKISSQLLSLAIAVH